MLVSPFPVEAGDQIFSAGETGREAFVIAHGSDGRPAKVELTWAESGKTEEEEEEEEEEISTGAFAYNP
eukprot:COSAG05_NODE_4196_length_1628_cov_1.367560_2_plen_69_part_00